MNASSSFSTSVSNDTTTLLPASHTNTPPSLHRILFADGAVSDPARPFVAIVGGSKVSSKIGVIESLLEKVDTIILGGGMIFTFFKAQGLGVGSSLVEEDKVALAASLLEKAEAKGVRLLLPTDVVLADKFDPEARTQLVDVDNIPDAWMVRARGAVGRGLRVATM